MLTLARTTVALVLLLSAAPTARAADLILEGPDFELSDVDVPTFVTPLATGAILGQFVSLPMRGKPTSGLLLLRLESLEGGPLTPGIYMDLGCETADAAQVIPEFRPNLCATGAFEVFEVGYDASGRISRLLLSFDSFGLELGKLSGVVDYRAEPSNDDGTDAFAPDPSPALLAGSLEVQFIDSRTDALPQRAGPVETTIQTDRSRSQVFDPRAARRGMPASETASRSEEIEPTSAPAAVSAPATISSDPPAGDAPPARSFLFRGLRPDCCGAGESPRTRPEGEARALPLPTTRGVTPAPSDPQRSIEVIERAAPKAIPEDSVWAGLAEPTSPRETAAPPPKDPEPRADSRDRVVEARTEFSWVWSLLVSLIELARSWLP